MVLKYATALTHSIQTSSGAPSKQHQTVLNFLYFMIYIFYIFQFNFIAQFHVKNINNIISVFIMFV